MRLVLISMLMSWMSLRRAIRGILIVRPKRWIK
jgi:hypothetical protein